jgi:foldase protein PrsA
LDSAASERSPIAYLNGEPIAPSELQTALFEAAGGEVLAEFLLERAVRRALERQQRYLTAQMIQRERQRLLQSLHPDPDTATRLLEVLEQRQGPSRFARRLRINAGLRWLVKDEVEVDEPLVRRAYRAQHGPHYIALLIVTPTLDQASRLVQQARQGQAAFSALAQEHSRDASGEVGGRLPPISPEDPSYPEAIRKALDRLEPGEVSDPIDLESGFAILKLERKTPGQDVQFEDVREKLTREVRLNLEQVQMQQKARAMLESINLRISDPTLKRSWQQHAKRIRLLKTN